MKSDVTVVIPTRNRPERVVHAVESALAQTYPIAEVVVVVDGPDDATVTALGAIGDIRVRPIVLATSDGGNNARNVGAANAKTEWVAFLDDDDEWLPNKLERQLAVAGDNDIVGCRFIARTSKGEAVWPKRLPAEGERFGDYLFSRRSFFNGEAGVITSTLLVRKQLIERIPFSLQLKRHQETDWVIRTTSQGSRIVYAPESLVIFNDDSGRVRVSTSYNWRQSLEWIRGVRVQMSPRAYSGFLLVSAGAAASDQRDWKAFQPILKEAFTLGRPTARHLLLYFAMWAVPQRMRQSLRSWISLKRRTSILP